MATTHYPPVVDDNPCWGGPEPECHDLDYLLRVLGLTNSASSSSSSPPEPEEFDGKRSSIRRAIERVVVYEDANYVVLNKPPDLRMDGPHRATVHKLLMYLFPPPSLLRSSGDASYGCDYDVTGDDEWRKLHQRLLESISILSKRTCLVDDPFRMVHQLDFATSGVLLVGRTRQATAAACRSFEKRWTDKVYVAVVVSYGSTDSDEELSVPLGSDFLERLPKLPPSSLDTWEDGTLERQYKRKRRRDTNGKTYVPISSVFDRWRGGLIRERNMTESGALRRRHDSLPSLPEPNVALTPDDVEELLSLGPTWKAAKSQLAALRDIPGHGGGTSVDWVDVVETMSKEYNTSLRAYYAEKDHDLENNAEGTRDGGENKNGGIAAGGGLPPLFRIESDDRDAFYVCASIGEIGGRFRVIVDPSVSRSGGGDDAVDGQHERPQMRPALTKCTVIWRGSYRPTNDEGSRRRGVPVAKVVLHPRTGRRHQLRVHLAHVAGCPILGDATYGGNSSVAGTGVDAARGAVCGRMCLHARELTIPLIGDESKTFVAPDPFVVRKDEGGQETLVIL
jgi:23S rRNA-/tRNA-specific pseudouridylate synthase